MDLLSPEPEPRTGSAPAAMAARDGPVEVVDTDLEMGGGGSRGEMNSNEGAGSASAGGVLSPSSASSLSSDSVCRLDVAVAIAVAVAVDAPREAIVPGALDAAAGLVVEIVPSGPPSHSAQNWMRSSGRPRARASAGGSRMSGVERQISQCRSVRVQPLSMYSPSCAGQFHWLD